MKPLLFSSQIQFLIVLPLLFSTLLLLEFSYLWNNYPPPTPPKSGHKSKVKIYSTLSYSTNYPTPRTPSSLTWEPHRISSADTFLLFQQTAVQSTILFLIRTDDMILQTCSVVKDSAATIQTDMAVSDSYA